MPSKRDVLGQLSRDELLAAIDHFGLAVQDRRVRDGLLDVVTSSKKATLAEVLPALSRERLKDVCLALGLDDGGREKALLVDRLLGRTNGAAVSTTNGSAKRTGNGGAEGGIAASIDLTVGEKLTIDKLEAYLWSAADILRGSIDSSDYKGFIFGFLFLKRLSDRFDEEVEALRSVPNSDAEDPDEHDFFVPKRARWSALQKVAVNVGETLNKAAAALEEANPKLDGVLAGIDFNDERKLGDSRNRDVVLGRLVQHFSRLGLRNSNLSEPDMLGRAYEYLIEKFADDAGKKGGEFYTPRMVVRLMVELLQPKEGMRICDPACGSGGMLIDCAKFLERHNQNPKNLSLFGQEKNLGTWAICRMNTLLHGLSDARIEKGDTIRDPKLRDVDGLMLFDRVIANPPFSQKGWGHEFVQSDPFGRFAFGIPPKKKQGSDLAFLSHMIATLSTKGMAGVILPHGALFRGGTEAEIRHQIVASDLLEAVIGLPPSLFYGTPIPAAILVLNRAKPARRKGRVLFVDASKCFEKGVNQDRLREEDVARIAAAFAQFTDVPEFARVVSAEDIADAQDEWRIETFVGPDAVGATLEGLALSAVERLLVESDSSHASLRRATRTLAHAEQPASRGQQSRTGFGPAPPGWEVRPFSELVEQVRDAVDVVPHETYREIGVRSHGRGIFHKEQVLGEVIGAKKVFRVVPGCLIVNVVFGWEGAVAVTTEAERGMLASHRFPMFRPRADLIELEFLRILFQSRPGTAALAKMSPGGAGRNKTLNQGSLRALPVAFPDLEMQRNIIDVVGRLESSIKHEERLLEQLRVTRRNALELLGTGQLLLGGD